MGLDAAGGRSLEAVVGALRPQEAVLDFKLAVAGHPNAGDHGAFWRAVRRPADGLRACVRQQKGSEGISVQRRAAIAGGG